MKKDFFDITYIGTALVDSLIRGFDPEPVSASGYRAESGSLSAGGEAVNGSAAASKLGLKARIFCSLGDDAAGDLVIASLIPSGTDCSAVIRDPGHPTPVTTMFVRPDGTRRSITNKAHSYNFHPERYPGLFAGSRIVALGSLFRAPFDDPEIILSVVRTAKQNGSIVFADTKLPNFRKLCADDITEALPYVDYIFPNEDEAAFLSGREKPSDWDSPEAEAWLDEAADALLGRGVKNVVIKLAGSGCFLKNAAERIRLAAFPIDAVDATGAGDNFMAGFAAEILRGESNKKALIFASACGAVCTTAVGAGTALKNRVQVEDFILSHPDMLSL